MVGDRTCCLWVFCIYRRDWILFPDRRGDTALSHLAHNFFHLARELLERERFREEVNGFAGLKLFTQPVFGTYEDRSHGLPATLQSETQVAQARMVVGTATQRPVIFTLGLLDRQVVDRCVPMRHEACFVELPVLVAVAAEPVS